MDNIVSKLKPEPPNLGSSELNNNESDVPSGTPI